MVRVLFICLGNICRSPMAEAVFRKMVQDEGLENQIIIDSAGIGSWHIGEQPHHGTRQILSKNGISFDRIQSRQIQPKDLEEFDYILAMDDENLEGIKKLSSASNRTLKGHMMRLMELVKDEPVQNVPDPYYTKNFDEVYTMVNRGCWALLLRIKEEMQEQS